MKPLKERILRGTAVVLALQVCAQLTGLLSQTLIAAWFGASAVTDAWLVAIAVLSLVMLWIQLPIRQVIIPIFRHDLTKHGEEAAWRNATTLMNNLLPLFAVITVVGWVASPWLVSLVGAGFPEESRRLSTSLTRLLFLGAIPIGVATFLAQIYYSYHRFFLPELTGSLSNLAIAGSLVVLGASLGIHGIAIGFLVGVFAACAVQLPILWEHRRFYSWRVDYRHPGMRELMHLSLPVMVGAGAVQTERVVDRVFASFLTAGSLSALAFARLLAQFPQTVLLNPFQKTTYPHFTTLIAAEEYRTLSHQLFRYLRFMLFLTVPAAMGLYVLGDVIVRVVYQRGAFDEAAAVLTSQALAFYALGLPAIFAARVFHKIFIALKDTRTATSLGLVRIGTKIVLTFALLPFFAHAAIALAESLSFLVQLVGLIVFLPAPIKAGQLRPTLRSLGGTVALAAAMGIVVYAVKTTSDGSVPVLVELVGLIVLGAVTYLTAGWLSRQGELEWLGRNVAALVQRRAAPAR